MRPFLSGVLALIATACGHEELNFALPDGGRSAAGQGSSTIEGAWAGTSAEVAAGKDPSWEMQSEPGDPPSAQDSSAEAGRNAGADAGGSHAGGAGGPRSRLVEGDPAGYPTPPGQSPTWCEQGHVFEEVCASGVDEDCDGMVDEFPGLSMPCRTDCGEGAYACDRVTNSLACLGCSMELRMPCGDGFVGAQEQCDPSAPGEQSGVTCTLTCERPGFVRCLFASGPEPALCTELQTCSERIGACVPVISARQPRCPKLRVYGSSTAEFYPMIETEDAQCWITCSEAEQCPAVLSECYMGFCAVPL